MKQVVQNLLIAFAIFVAIATVFAFIQSEGGYLKQPSEITLSQLAGKIKNDEIKEIVINGNDLDILLKNDEREKAQKGPNTDLEETLANYGVTPEKLTSLSITYKKDSV